MPQLMRESYIGERGSALVAVIAFAIIISIAAGGLLMLAANSVGNESAELDDCQALLAAESGLQVGLRWLGEPLNWQTANTAADSTFITVPDLNGMTLKVYTARGSGRLVLGSRAVNVQMKYIKEVACRVDSSFGFGLATNSWDPAFPNLDDIWFDGPVQANAPLQLMNPPVGKRGNVYFLNGKISGTDTRVGLGSYGIGPSGNDYNYGIDVLNGLWRDGGRGRTLDMYFDNTFAYTKDSVRTPGANLNGSTVLPLNQSTNRAFLYFDTTRNAGTLIGRATYYYFNNNIPLPPHLIPNINNLTILLQNSVDVLGVIQGQATVVSPPGCDIHPVGDLIYADFTKLNPAELANYPNYNPVTNYGISLSSTNYLALIAGGDIRFRSGNEKRFDITNPSVLKDTVVFGGTFLWVTAALFATNTGRGIIWDNPLLPLANYNYKLYVIGSRTVDRFFNYPSYFGASANTQFRFYYDRRFLGGLSAPGVPAFRRITPAGNNLYFLKTTNRRELNLARP